MKYYFFLLFTLFSVFGFSQKSKIDLKAIEKALKIRIHPTIMINLSSNIKGIPNL